MSTDTTQKLQFPLRIPFVEELGLELWAFGDGKAELRVDLADAHLNSWAVAHGGVLMTMLDVAMAHAARSANGQAPDLGPGVAIAQAAPLVIGRALCKEDGVGGGNGPVFEPGTDAPCVGLQGLRMAQDKSASGQRLPHCSGRRQCGGVVEKLEFHCELRRVRQERSDSHPEFMHDIACF